MKRSRRGFDNTRLLLWAHTRHDGLVSVATLRTFKAGKRLTFGPQPWTSRCLGAP